MRAPSPKPAVQSRPEPAPRTRSLPQFTREQGLYGLVVAAAFAVRIWDAGSRAMHGDEAVHAWMAWNLYNGTGYQYDPVYHGPLQFPVTALFFFLFGVSNLSGRLMAILFGTALVALPYFLRPYMGRTAALLSSVLIAFSPAYVYVSRLERDDIFTSLFALLTVIGILGYVRTRRIRFVYLAGLSLAFSLTAMENTYITMFVFGSYLLVAFGSEYLARRPLGNRVAEFWARTGAPHLVTLTTVGVALAVLLLAFLVTIFTGLYPPVPVVAALLIVALVHRQAFLAARENEGDGAYLGALKSISGQQWLTLGTMVIAVLFLFFSTFGTNLKGLWDASQPFLNNGHATCAGAGDSFPLNPCRKDIVGGLFYWLSQHSVARGGQPWFYYSLLYGLYEQIALILGAAGMIWYLRRPTMFTALLTYWGVLMFGIYSWAGEKFSWLMIHPLMPFVLLASMFVVEMVRRRGVVRYLILAIAGILGLLQLHNLYEVNFVNGADPVEMMVYVQSSPDTPRVASSIESLSNKITNGNDLELTIDNEDTWPFAWYLRDMTHVSYPDYSQLQQKQFLDNPAIILDDTHQAAIYPKIKNSYTGHRYRLRWWFPEDYKSLSWSSFFRDAVNPGYWRVIADWQLKRREFGPKQAVYFYYYVKNGVASPY